MYTWNRVRNHAKNNTALWVIIGVLLILLALNQPIGKWIDANITHTTALARLQQKVDQQQGQQQQQGQDGQQDGNQQTDADHTRINTATAKSVLGLDVQRLNSETGDGFVWRDTRSVIDATCPLGWICTLHVDNGKVYVYVGDGTSYSIFAGTFRKTGTYPSGDAVYTPCQLLQKEQQFGADESPSFDVFAGNFSCDGQNTSTDGTSNGDNSNGDTTSDETLTSCPKFGGRTTHLVDQNTACKLDWNQSLGTVTMTIPNGWTAETDTDGVKNAGESATFGSATFRKAA